ncbi:MAG: ABC transporter ATP-binding protein [Vicinamibacteria bacterium]|nr:ABC transporter ATP-binding protein [Vicinamibacteria bacterium]
MRVRFEKVGKQFGAHRALREIDLDIQSGECLVLLGPSGCGKTTLLRLLAGLEDADTGRILVGDRDVALVKPADRDVAMVFQNYALYPHLSVFENVAFPLRARGTTSVELDRRVNAALARMDLAGLEGRRPSQLSGGQQQRVALARALVRNPAVYLMDEPLSNLDAQLRLQTRTELRRLQQELRTTTVYVTHDQGEAMTLGDRIALLRDGTIEQVGPPLELYRRPATRFVATFLGSPPINIWPAGVDADGSLRVAGGALVLPGSRARGATLDRLEVGVRPEDVVVFDQGGAGRTEGEILLVEPLGNETIVTLLIEGSRVVARASSEFQARPGGLAFFSISSERALLFSAETGRRLD